jgi:hypothetical protein
MNNITKHFRHLKSSIRRRARDRGVPCTLSRTDLRRLFSEKTHCEICGVEFVLIPNHDAHASVERIIPSLGYIIQNVVIICRRCNSIKGELDAFGSFKDQGDEYKKMISDWAEIAAQAVKQRISNENSGIQVQDTSDDDE